MTVEVRESIAAMLRRDTYHNIMWNVSTYSAWMQLVQLVSWSLPADQGEGQIYSSWPTAPHFLRSVLVHVYLCLTMFNDCRGSQSKHVVELQNCINAPICFNMSFTLSQSKQSRYNLASSTFSRDMFIGIATNIYCNMGNDRVSGFCTVTTRKLRYKAWVCHRRGCSCGCEGSQLLGNIKSILLVSGKAFFVCFFSLTV